MKNKSPSSESWDNSVHNTVDWFYQKRFSNLNEAQQAEFKQWLEECEEHSLQYAEYDLIDAGCEVIESEKEILALRSKVQQTLNDAPKSDNTGDFFSTWLYGWKSMSMILTACCALVFIFLLPKQEKTGFEIGLSTEVGEQTVEVLPDGSKIEMNTDTRLKIAYSNQERKVVLSRGEAVFEVSSMPDKPFTVKTSAFSAVVIGTRFTIFDNDRFVSAVVFEGKVNIRGKGKKVQNYLLEKGEGLRYFKDGHIEHITDIDEESFTSWRAGKLEFKQHSLKAAIDEYNRYSKRKIIIVDPKLKNMQISGVFNIGKPETFALALCKLLPVEAEYWSDSITLRESLADTACQNAKDLNKH